MAESKNKSKAKKGATKKATTKSTAKTSAKVSSKPVSAKKTASKSKVAAVSKKNNKATTKKDVKAQKKQVSTTEKKPVSDSVRESPSSWKIISVILGILLVVLVIAIGYMYFGNINPNTNNTNSTTNSTTTTNTAGSVELLILNDPSCVTCGEDTFADQVKQNLISNLVTKKVTYTSSEGKAFVDAISPNQYPAYLFSENIDQRSDWVNLSGAFVPVTVSGAKYYMLNEQFVSKKIMTKDPVITDTATIYGDANAKVTIYEFTDFECPFCAIAEGNSELVTAFSQQRPGYVPPMPNVIKDYVDTGKVKVVFYNFPIASLHPKSKIAHLAAMCANEQGKFKLYERKLWDDRSTWTAATDRAVTLKSYAKDLGLDTTQFDKCLDDEKYSSQIDSELQLGQSYGVTGTPGFFIGREFIAGAEDYSVFKQIIDAQLNE